GELMALASRATRVTSAMLEGVASRPGVKVLNRFVAALGWVLTAVGAIVFPRAALRTPVRFLAAITAVFGTLLVILGTLFNWDAAAATGWPLIAVGVAGLVVGFLVRLARRRIWPALIWIVGLAVVGFAAYGVVQLIDQVRK